MTSTTGALDVFHVVYDIVPWSNSASDAIIDALRPIVRFMTITPPPKSL